MLKFMRLGALCTVLLAGTVVRACDICGCSSGGSYLGILPQFQRNFAGTRFQFRNFLHPQTPLNINGESIVQEDRMYTQEMWFRFYPKKRLQFFAFLPYKVNTRIESLRTTTIRGVGDMSITANYTLLNTGDSSRDWKNLLIVGGGLKLPTGKYQQRDANRVMLPASFQVGTGAYTYILNAFHTLRYKAFGLNTNVQFFMNAENELQYQYGNQLSTSLSFFYWKNFQNTTILFNAGPSFESASKDHEYGAVKPYTGGNVLLANAGIDVYYRRFVLNAFVQLPVTQEVPYAQPVSQYRLGCGISYFLD